MTDTSAPLQRLTAERGEVMQRSAAGWLAALGVSPGDRIAVDHDGSDSYLAFVVAALRCGVVPVPLPDGMPEAERHSLVADAEVRARVGPEDWPTVFGHVETELASIPLTRPMLYTSGTTGRRKGVWFGVWTPDVARRAYLDEHDQWGFVPDDTHLVCSPLYHSAPLRFAMHTLLAGGDVLLQRRFNASASAEVISDGEATTAFVVPAHLQRILELQPRPPSQRLRWISHAGSACPDALKRRVLDWAPPEKVWEFYGSTEAQFTACRGDEWLENPGTVGRARRGRSLSVDQNDVVWCAQPDFARFAYWRAADKTATAWNGAACTVGDLGSIDDSGRLFLRGRREDLIVSGGVNVYPAEVERVMGEDPGVSACAAFGVDDERWGQAVVFAWVGDSERAALEERARRCLAPASRPKRFIKVDEMPLGTLGKVSRLRLAEWYRTQVGPDRRGG